MSCQAQEGVEGVLQIIEGDDAEGLLARRILGHEIRLRTMDLD